MPKLLSGIKDFVLFFLFQMLSLMYHPQTRCSQVPKTTFDRGHTLESDVIEICSMAYRLIINARCLDFAKHSKVQSEPFFGRPLVFNNIYFLCWNHSFRPLEDLDSELEAIYNSRYADLYIYGWKDDHHWFWAWWLVSRPSSGYAFISTKQQKSFWVWWLGKKCLFTLEH